MTTVSVCGSVDIPMTSEVSANLNSWVNYWTHLHAIVITYLYSASTKRPICRDATDLTTGVCTLVTSIQFLQIQYI